jgi:hypothetical protein
MHVRMAHYSDILGLLKCEVVSMVSCCMGHGGRTGECLGIVAAREGNYTPVEDEIDLFVAPIDRPCSV